MLFEPIVLTPSSPCPNCESAIRKVRVPTRQERDAAADADASPVPSHLDAASDDVRRLNGDLFRCDRCQWQGRIKAV